MIISVINRSDGALSDHALLAATRAVNRQIAEDFCPYWGFGAQLRLEGKTGRRRASLEPADMRGDAVLYVRERVKRSEDDGYHDRHYSGIPFGFVYLEISKALKEDWTVTLSHEALELVADPEANLLVQGPHPAERRKVFHWFEMCDAVQDESYRVDGVRVSNFVLPLYFTSGAERGGRNDFLGTLTEGRALRSFGVNPGGYIGFFDPKVSDDVTWPPDDPRASKRMQVKAKLQSGRGVLRRERTRQ